MLRFEQPLAALALGVVLALAAPLSAGAQTSCPPEQVITSPIIVPLDDTGIADWRFLNPRAPYPVLRGTSGFGIRPAEKACWTDANLRQVEIVFENRTAARSFNVDIAFEITPPWTTVRGALDRLRYESQACNLLGCASDDRGRRLIESSSALQNAEALYAEAQALVVQQESVGALSRGRATELIGKSLERKSQLEAAQERVEAELLERILARLEPEDRNALEARIMARASPSYHGLVASWLRAHVEQPDPGSSTGIFDAALDSCHRALNPVKASSLASTQQIESIRRECGRPQPEDREQQDGVQGRSGCAEDACADSDTEPSPSPGSVLGVFATRPNELSWAEDRVDALRQALDRAFTVQLLADRGQGDEDLLRSCKAKGGKMSCSLSLTLGLNQEAVLDGDLVAALPKGLATFGVTFEGEADIPTNATGYLRTAFTWDDLASVSTSWRLSAAIAYARSPELPGQDEDGDDILLTLDDPYAGDELRRFTGAGSLRLTQKLGTRADGTATLAFKSGDLGAADASNEVDVTDYQVRFYTAKGTQMRFGKFQFLSSIAANPKGEGVEWNFRSVSVGHISERESLEGKADDADQDARTLIVQLRNLTPPASPFENVGKRFDVVGLWGEDEKPENQHEFWTLGGRAYLAKPCFIDDWSLLGDLQVFESQIRRGNAASAHIRDGRGTSWLASARLADVVDRGDLKNESSRWAMNRKRKAKLGETLWSASLTVGQGDGDDPATPDEHEGFLGKTAGFKPDKLYLRSFASEIDTGDGVVYPGLSNKTYYGLSFETRTFSVLDPLWELFGGDEPVVSRSSRVSLHHYRYREPVRDEREIGTELDLDFVLQAPKSVTTTLGLGWFFPGPATEDYFVGKRPWALELKVAVDFQ